MSELVIVKIENTVATLTLNRPQAFNAFDLPMVERFAAVLVALAADRGVKAVVLSGAGPAFCAGGDLKWALSFPDGPEAAFHALAARFHLAVTEIRRMRKPVIAAVNGIAAGGGFSLALACDFRIMAESAVLRQAYTSSGLSIDGGGTFTLPRIVGLARALEIAAFDQPIPASLALSWGLATRVAADGAVLREAVALANDLAARSVHSFGASKQLLTDAFETAFETHIERERRALSDCVAHADGGEGLRAFAEKRKPRFTDA
ncbi:MAG: enoyl-CoA hydratase-related protein [Pseudomonadota bacterium]